MPKKLRCWLCSEPVSDPAAIVARSHVLPFSRERIDRFVVSLEVKDEECFGDDGEICSVCFPLITELDVFTYRMELSFRRLRQRSCGEGDRGSPCAGLGDDASSSMDVIGSNDGSDGFAGDAFRPHAPHNVPVERKYLDGSGKKRSKRSSKSSDLSSSHLHVSKPSSKKYVGRSRKKAKIDISGPERILDGSLTSAESAAPGAGEGDAEIDILPNCHNAYAVTDKILSKYSVEREDFIVREDRLECKQCGHLCKTLGAMEGHINLVHRGARPYPCDMCSAAFANASSLKFHAARHKSGPRVCYCCDRTFPSSMHMRKHLNYLSRKSDGMFSVRKSFNRRKVASPVSGHDGSPSGDASR